MLNVMDTVISRCSREETNLVAITAKKIWARRNDVLHGGAFIHPNRIVSDAETILHTFHSVSVINRRIDQRCRSKRISLGGWMGKTSIWAL